jgi:2'-5' RNA ligase
MRLYAVVVPPVEEVNRLFDSIGAPGDDLLDWEPPSAVRIGLDFFGNVILADVERLTSKLAVVVAQSAPLSLHFIGGSALDEDGDDSVWAKVAGDVDELRVLAMSIAAVGRSEGFAVDRRWYRPRARVARVNALTTLPSLQSLLPRLEAYHGPPWSVTDVSVIEAKADTTFSGQQGVVQLASMPLAS